MNALSVAFLALLVAWPALAAAQTIKVGAVVPLTGRYGGGGAQVRAGYEIGVEHVNAAGGVDVGGKKLPLQLVLLDDEAEATKTGSRLQTPAPQGVVAYPGGVDAGKAAGYQGGANGGAGAGARAFSDLTLKAKSASAALVLGLPPPPEGMTMVKKMRGRGLSPKMLPPTRAPDPPVWSKNL